MGTMKISDQVTISGQPSSEQLKELAGQGFKSVVNFRTEGEDAQPLSPADEGREVEELGMKYLHVPVSMETLSDETVDRFREQFDKLPKPVFAHCKGGTRAGAMVMMHTASEQGMSGDQTLQQAEKMGFKCNQAELRQFVVNYIDQHTRTIS